MQKAIVICMAGTLLLIGSWMAINRLAFRTSSRIPLWILAGNLQAAGVVIMLSGYATGGQLTVPLAASLIGVGLASIVTKNSHRTECALGIGIGALYALLIIGRLFAGLSDLNAMLLFIAPLCAWLPEGIPSGPRLRSALQFVLPAIPVAVALFFAQQQFAADSMYG